MLPTPKLDVSRREGVGIPCHHGLCGDQTSTSERLPISLGPSSLLWSLEDHGARCQCPHCARFPCDLSFSNVTSGKILIIVQTAGKCVEVRFYAPLPCYPHPRMCPVRNMLDRAFGAAGITGSTTGSAPLPRLLLLCLLSSILQALDALLGHTLHHAHPS